MGPFTVCLHILLSALLSPSLFFFFFLSNAPETFRPEQTASVQETAAYGRFPAELADISRGPTTLFSFPSLAFVWIRSWLGVPGPERWLRVRVPGPLPSVRGGVPSTTGEGDWSSSGTFRERPDSSPLGRFLRVAGSATSPSEKAGERLKREDANHCERRSFFL